MTKSASVMNYSFKEAKLGQNFCQEKTAEARTLIELSTPFTVVGLPTSGTSFFIKYLDTLPNINFLHIDINELPVLSKIELFRLILKELGEDPADIDEEKLVDHCKQRLEVLISKNRRVVLGFNRFDRLIKEFNQNFFANLRTLWEVDKEKIVLIFTANKPILELAPEAVSGGNFNLCSKCLYLPPYSQDDLLKLLDINAPALKSNPGLKNAIELSGGHYQLFILLLKSDQTDEPLSDPAIKFQLKELYQFLNYQQRKQLQKIALGKSAKRLDPFLTQVGFVKLSKTGQTLFTPLLTEYIKTNIRLRLPLKESRLFQLLKEKEGKLVSKDTIFEILWHGEEDKASDWALNALIYRLRKNPTFASSGYVIESQKKAGYYLVRG